VAAYTPAHCYDFLISNPPFFRNSLTGPDAARNRARHTHSLNDTALLHAAQRLLAPGGRIAILLPAAEFALTEALFRENGWHTHQKLEIQPSSTIPVNRVIGIFSQSLHAITVTETLTIYDADKNYTPEFIDLLRPFYLKL
jgi:tRNA1Val (adenine37-N6)-methyltransferase